MTGEPRGFSRVASQGASRAAPGKSGLHARGEGERVLALESREGTRVKKAERRRIDAFELWCWRRLLRVPWTARRSNQSILKEISPGISLERMMLKLKLQYFGHLMGRVDSLEKTLGGTGGRRRRGGQRMRPLTSQYLENGAGARTHSVFKVFTQHLPAPCSCGVPAMPVVASFNPVSHKQQGH